MSALNNQTNRNASRFFFATAEAGGDQTLGLQFGTTGGTPNLSTMAVTISGGGGNGVIVNQAPSFQATEYIFAEEGLGVYGSTYFTPSTLATTITGINLSSDRRAGYGIATIESYGGNGSTRGFEFLTRGVDGALLSTTSVAINSLFSSIGAEGASMVMAPAGTLGTQEVLASFMTSVDEPPGGGGRACYLINDLSGVIPVNRWALGEVNIPAGSNTGSDFALFSYGDDGTFITRALSVLRADGAVEIPFISSMSCELGGTAKGQVFPILKDNVEFGAPNSNVAVLTSTLQVLFSTPVANLNPNTQTLLNINFANALSSGSNLVNYKIGFSTATAFTNIIQTTTVPGGQWTPSDQPSTTTPIGHTNICCVLDPDGLDASGAGFLFVAGNFTEAVADDQLFIAKGVFSEAPRNALTYKSI